ncbi:uncharacterized protein LOC126620760 isoform X2 [Malus sylvestris]|uniref:uncharacterized protein LOC126620760 isoform X2 n=1 Tax=Malus sylvestris TaxID=3752 RepID=UPI0021ABE81F|nr:uncharacterized protein LOC126620760 isoform X2 [Malus sylvestris]XP_050144997.1 uncharacterized protein LOC126620760 isoform X2 [Malus sylvestris]
MAPATVHQLLLRDSPLLTLGFRYQRLHGYAEGYMVELGCYSSQQAGLLEKQLILKRGFNVQKNYKCSRRHQHGRWLARIGKVARNKDLYLGHSKKGHFQLMQNQTSFPAEKH